MRGSATRSRRSGSRATCSGRARSPADQRRRVLVEFVSANPTGPLNAANGRHAAYGDSLARVLEFAGPRRRARVLHQRPRDADRALRPLDRRADDRRARARGRLPGRVHDRACRAAARRGTRSRRTSTTLARRAIELMVEQVRQTLERFRVRFDHFFSERSLHEGDAIDKALARVEEDGPRLLLGWRDVAADVGVRRRQGPRAAPLVGRAHLLRVRHRLSPGQARAWLRPDDQPAGRRPPRLPGAHVRAVRRARRSRQARADHHAARALRGARRAREDVQARAATSSRSTSCWTTSASMPHAGSCSRDRTTRHSISTWTWRASAARTTPSTTCSTRTRASPAILRKAGEERVARARAADLSAGRAKLEPAERALVKRLLELPGEVVEIGRAPRAAPAHQVRARRGLGLPRLLSRLPRRGRRAGGARGLPARAVRRDPPGDRAGARPRRRRGAGEHVSVAEGLDTLAHRLRPARDRARGSARAAARPRCRRVGPVPAARRIRPRRAPARSHAARAADPAARRPPLVHRRARRVPEQRDVHGELRAAHHVARCACRRRRAFPGSER